MRRIPLAAVGVALALSACSIPFTKSNDDRKAACDRIAAQAIQTTSLADAKVFAAQASECYAAAQSR